MKSPYISDLQPNQVTTGIFIVQSKDVRQKKTGEPYLSLMLGDRTGEVDAKMWDNVAEVIDTFERDDFIRVRGQLQIFQNRPQFTIHKMQRLSDSDVDFADYFPASTRDPGEMFAELRGIIAGMSNPHLRGLLDALFDDPAIAQPYRLAPAAKMIHHAYLGGLLEHVLSLCALCRFMAGHYKNIDLDLLLTGAILHDIGKIRELNYNRSFGYSSDGQLLGHIVIGLQILDDKLRGLPEFPPRLRSLVEHLVLSHHGELEYGSPKVPMFPEALLLHHLDNLDSKMECMRMAIERDRLVEGCWTSFTPALERTVLKKDKYLSHEETPPSPETPDPPPAGGALPSSSPSAPVRKASPSPFGQKLGDALRREP